MKIKVNADQISAILATHLNELEAKMETQSQVEALERLCLTINALLERIGAKVIGRGQS